MIERKWKWVSRLGSCGNKAFVSRLAQGNLPSPLDQAAWPNPWPASWQRPYLVLLVSGGRTGKSCRLGLALQREIFVKDRILDNPGILGATALARIDDERFLLQGHSCQSARHDPYAIRPGENEGPQIDVARRDSGIEKSRGCGERERWLSNEISRIAGEL